jgi:hypothetical protein
MIEAAVTLPLFLLITFGVMEFGNMYMSRYQALDVASSVRDYLQANPSASSADLETFVTNLGFGSLKNTGSGEDNNVFATIKIQSEKTVMTAAQFDGLCSEGGGKNWVNPWLGGDPADDKNDYYIHICYPYTYNMITPLSGLTGGVIPSTKIMNSKALAYIAGEISCPDNQVLQSFTGGSATCVARDGNYSCASGQTLEKIVDGNPVCVAKDGDYTCASGQVLSEVKDGAAVCVNRDASYACVSGYVLKSVQNGSPTCVDMDQSYTCSGDSVLQATAATGAVCVDKDKGRYTCPEGEFAYAIEKGVPSCSKVSISKQPIDVNVCGRIKSKTSDCRQGEGEPTNNMVVVGIMPDGDVWCAPLNQSASSCPPAPPVKTCYRSIETFRGYSLNEGVCMPNILYVELPITDPLTGAQLTKCHDPYNSRDRCISLCKSIPERYWEYYQFFGGTFGNGCMLKSRDPEVDLPETPPATSTSCPNGYSLKSGGPSWLAPTCMANEVTSIANICDDPDPAKKAIINFYKSKGRCADADGLEWWADSYRRNPEQTLIEIETLYNVDINYYDRFSGSQTDANYMRKMCNVTESHRIFYKHVDSTTSPKCILWW